MEIDTNLNKLTNTCSTCEGNLCDREDVRKDNWVDPVVPVVLRHYLRSLYLSDLIRRAGNPMGTNESQNRDQ